MHVITHICFAPLTTEARYFKEVYTLTEGTNPEADLQEIVDYCSNCLRRSCWF